MPVTQTQRRIKNVERDVQRFRHDVRDDEDWQRKHVALAEQCWPWEDLVAKANFLFDRIMDLDADIQEHVLTHKEEHDPNLENEVLDLVRDWLETCHEVLPHVDRLEREYGEFEDAPKFRKNLSEAQGILTDDCEFFAGDGLVQLRDEAIEAYRAGSTEPMSDGGSRS